MPVYLTSEGLLTTVPRDQKPRGKIQDRVITTRREWEAVASTWPLKQLVAIWNGLPGVKPVQRFTSRQIAVERIWRVIAGPEPVRRRSGRSRKDLRLCFGKVRRQHRPMPCSSAHME